MLDIIEFSTKFISVLEEHEYFDDMLYGFSQIQEAQNTKVTWYNTDGDDALYDRGMNDINEALTCMPRSCQLFLTRHELYWMPLTLITQINEMKPVLSSTPESLALFDVIDQLALTEDITAENKTPIQIDKELHLCYDLFDCLSNLDPVNTVTLELAGINCTKD